MFSLPFSTHLWFYSIGDAPSNYCGSANNPSNHLEAPWVLCWLRAIGIVYLGGGQRCPPSFFANMVVEGALQGFLLRTGVIVAALDGAVTRRMPLYPSVTQSGQLRSDSRSSSPLMYCKLLEGSRRYSGRQVRVTAHWRFGFETTVLFDPACPERPGAWLEMS